MKTEKELEKSLAEYKRTADKMKKAKEEKWNKKEAEEAEYERKLELLISKIIRPALNPLFQIVKKNGQDVGLPRFSLIASTETQGILFDFGLKYSPNFLAVEIEGAPLADKLNCTVVLSIDNKETKKTVTLRYEDFTKEFIRNLMLDNFPKLIEGTVISEDDIVLD